MDIEQNPNDSLSEGKSKMSVSDYLAEERTTLAFQRTRLAADRTLMGIIRTSLSLIGFGFTIFEFAHYLKKNKEIKRELYFPAGTPGLTLVEIGIGLLLLGIIYHITFMLQVRKERDNLKKQGLIIPIDTFPVSLILIISILILLLGIFTIFKMLVNPVS